MNLFEDWIGRIIMEKEKRIAVRKDLDTRYFYVKCTQIGGGF
jgi:hypothetical protein